MIVFIIIIIIVIIIIINKILLLLIIIIIIIIIIISHGYLKVYITKWNRRTLSIYWNKSKYKKAGVLPSITFEHWPFVREVHQPFYISIYFKCTFKFQMTGATVKCIWKRYNYHLPNIVISLWRFRGPVPNIAVISSWPSPKYSRHFTWPCPKYCIHFTVALPQI